LGVAAEDFDRPASVTCYNRRAGGESFDNYKAVRLRFGGYSHEHVAVGHHLCDIVSRSEPVDTRQGPCFGLELGGVALLPRHRGSRDDQLEVGSEVLYHRKGL
jgi:hypothetical protein